VQILELIRGEIAERAVSTCPGAIGAWLVSHLAVNRSDRLSIPAGGDGGGSGPTGNQVCSDEQGHEQICQRVDGWALLVGLDVGSR
jgi:hypothetical protein